MLQLNVTPINLRNIKIENLYRIILSNVITRYKLLLFENYKFYIKAKSISN